MEKIVAKNAKSITEFISGKINFNKYNKITLSDSDLGIVLDMLAKTNVTTERRKELVKELAENKLFLNSAMMNLFIDVEPNNNDTFTAKAGLIENSIMFMVKEHVLILLIKSMRLNIYIDLRNGQATVQFYGGIEKEKEYYAVCKRAAPTIIVFMLELLLHYSKIANQEKEKIKIVNRRNIGNKKGKTKYVNTYSISLNNIKRYDYGKNYVPERKYQRHIDSWEVRGHWRTYKSGKKVWIKPSVKGDKSKQAKKQVYEI